MPNCSVVPATISGIGKTSVCIRGSSAQRNALCFEPQCECLSKSTPPPSPGNGGIFFCLIYLPKATSGFPASTPWGTTKPRVPPPHVSRLFRFPFVKVKSGSCKRAYQVRVKLLARAPLLGKAEAGLSDCSDLGIFCGECGVAGNTLGKQRASTTRHLLEKLVLFASICKASYLSKAL